MAFNPREALRKIPPTIRPVIREGETGWWVRLLRKCLSQVGLIGAEMTENPSVFDSELAGIVSLYQKRHGLTVDGIAGPQTWAALASEDSHDVRLVQNGEARAAQIRESIVAVAHYAEKMNIREEGGNNRGPIVEWILDYAKGKPGWPWCVAFAWAVVSHGHLIENSRPPAVPRLSCSMLVNWARTEGRLRTGAPAPGDLWVLHQRGRGYYHVGVVVEVLPNGAIVTIEGNTGPQPGPQDADGDGVYLRKRWLPSGVAVDVA